MTNREIIDQLKQLTTVERLAVIEAATRLIREDLSQPEANQNAEMRNWHWRQRRCLQTTNRTGN